MQPDTFIGIIPARYASTRFPGKPLADIGGMTMIERVYRQASKALDHVLVATDDARIFNTVEAFGGNAIMTSPDHRSGTDRCFEAYTKSGSYASVIINIQGDEPFVDPAQIEALKSCFDTPQVQIATLVRRFNPERGFDALFNPNTPKVVMDSDMNALYFKPLHHPLCAGRRMEGVARQNHIPHPYRHVCLSCRRTCRDCKVATVIA